jgi:hypothetical protein
VGTEVRHDYEKNKSIKFRNSCLPFGLESNIFTTPTYTQPNTSEYCILFCMDVKSDVTLSKICHIKIYENKVVF